MYGNYCMYCRSNDPDHDARACLNRSSAPNGNILRRPWFCLICGAIVFLEPTRTRHYLFHARLKTLQDKEL